MLATPLQLAVMTARLATGREVTPRLIKSVNGIEEPIKGNGSLGMKEANLRKMRKSMYSVVNDRRGTGYRSRIIAEGMRMAGKTGTSQVRSAVVNNNEVPWEQRDHALFVSFAPYDNPKYACAVLVEHGGGGSTAAAPIARDVMLQALYGGEPPLEAYPTADRARIKTQQRALRDVQPEARIKKGKDQA